MASSNVTVSLLMLRKHVTTPSGGTRARRLIRRLVANETTLQVPAPERKVD